MNYLFGYQLIEFQFEHQLIIYPFKYQSNTTNWNTN